MNATSSATPTPASDAVTAPDSAARMRERYGRETPPTTRRWIITGIAAVLVALGVAWLIWAQPLGDGSGLESADIGFAADSGTQMSVSWQLTVRPGTEVTCVIQAQNEAQAIVGWLELEIPASDARIREFTTAVRTSEPANSGRVYDCWVP